MKSAKRLQKWVQKASTQFIKYKIYTREKEHNARHKVAAADATGKKRAWKTFGCVKTSASSARRGVKGWQIRPFLKEWMELRRMWANTLPRSSCSAWTIQAVFRGEPWGSATAAASCWAPASQLPSKTKHTTDPFVWRLAHYSIIDNLICIEVLPVRLEE